MINLSHLYGFRVMKPQARIILPQPLPQPDHWYSPGYGQLATYSVRFCPDAFIWQDVTAFCMKQIMNRNPIADATNLGPMCHVVTRSQPGM